MGPMNMITLASTSSMKLSAVKKKNVVSSNSSDRPSCRPSRRVRSTEGALGPSQANSSST